MKKVILMCCVLLLCGGCWESLALVGGGAAGGMTLQRIIQQQKEANAADIEMMEQQLADQDAAIAAEPDEAKKAELQKARDNTMTVLLDLKSYRDRLNDAELARKTDWGKPTAVITFISTLLMGLLADRERRKKNKTATAFTEVVLGGEKFKKGTDNTVVAFKAAMGEVQSPETKKMVAVIKA